MGSRWPVGKRRWLGGLVVLVILGAAVAVWTGRDQWWGRYAVYRLTRATDADRETWVERAIRNEAVGLPSLLDCLTQDDTRACTNARVALERLAGRWPADDDRRVRLMGQLAEDLARYSPPGRAAALDLAIPLLSAGRDKPAAALAAPASRLLAAAAHRADADVRTRGLTLAEAVLHPSAPAEVLSACRELTEACLRDATAANRLRAIQLAAQPPLNLLAPVVPLLRDSAPEVRRAALLAVGPCPDVLATDDLLPWLHDPDPGVCRLCEKALQGRGLRDDHIQLGRLLTAAAAQTRLQVLERLRQTRELEPGIWLRRLSHDPSAAVRAAALRAAVEFTPVDLTERMRQVVREDPSPTVRQIARFYLSYRKSGQ